MNKTIIIALTAALLLAPLAALHAAEAVEQPTIQRARPWKSGTHTITVDGVDRTFVLEVPSRLEAGAALVMIFHAYGGSAESFRRHAGFTALTENHGFVAVYPQGTRDARGKSFFNVGYAFHDSKVDDVKFARELSARLVRDLELDPRAVFSTGMSNGGDMSYLLACQPEPFVRAIAPVAGTMMASWSSKFVPHARTPVLAVHGTNDKVTLWAGDPENRDGWGAYWGVETVMDLWVKGLSLEKSETTELAGLTPRKERCKILFRRWWTTTDFAEVRLYEIQGGGHAWPGNLGNKDRSTAAEIWSFFEAHRPRIDRNSK